LIYFDAMNNPLLQVNNLTTIFRSGDGVFKAVNDISFDLCSREVLGVAGESGSGKSVTALSIMQLMKSPSMKVSSGNIIYNNGAAVNLLQLDAKGQQAYRGKEIAMIFQEPMTSLNPVITCGKQVSEAMCLHLQVTKKEAREKTMYLFKRVKLPQPESIYDCFPHQLSGGQKQRAMIAMAISCNPKILIADEPTTALDVTVQASLIELLKELQQETGMSIIFITHDLGILSQIADRVLVMHNGCIIEQGAVEQVFKNPVHPYTKGLLSCRPSLFNNKERLPVIEDFMDTSPNANVAKEHNSQEDSRIDEFRNNASEQKKDIYITPPFISVRNLSVSYSRSNGFLRQSKEIVRAVDDISFDIYKGETLGLVGESGCGKTTLGKALLNMVKSTGSVMFKGKNISSLSVDDMRPLRKNMQMIFQDPYASLNPRLTIGEAIMEPMLVHSIGNSVTERKENALLLLEKVGLKSQHFKRYPHEFSSGQRQRIAIARALALSPEFIICDECVSSLDVSVQAQVLNLINELKCELGFTTIFISHDLSVVRYMSDRIMVMNNGKIVELGDATEVYQHPKSEYTRMLIDAIPVI